MLSRRYFPYVAALSDEPRATRVMCSTRVSARPSVRASGQPSSRSRRTTPGCSAISERSDISADDARPVLPGRTIGPLDAGDRESEPPREGEWFGQHPTGPEAL